MFGIVGYKMFILSGIILNITPGSDTIYILSKSGTGGRGVGIASALGISTGILVHTFLAALGLSVILAKSATAFAVMKLLGTAYLVFMGVRNILSGTALFTECEQKKQESVLKAYRQGVLTNILNPKVALFFLALLPQFVAADNSYGAIPFLILGLTFFGTSTLWCVFLAYMSSFVSRLLNKNAKIQAIANKAAGCIYIVLGLNILRAKQN